MILEIYDKDTNQRIDIIRTYEFVQYTKYFNEVGEFQLKVPVTEKSLPYLMVIGNYILFDKDVMGVIKYIHKEGLETPTVEIKGYLVNHLLTYRSSLIVKRYTGKVFEIERKIINDNIIQPNDYRRQIVLIRLADEYPDSEKTTYQNTGDNMAEQVYSLNSHYGYGYDLVPIIEKYNQQTGKLQNLAALEFRQYVPVDHTMRNTEGNTPIIFSADLNNLSSLTYTKDDTEVCNVAIVAGEDVGEDRKIEETGDLSAVGLNRIELYVDARDLQSENVTDADEGVLSYDDSIAMLDEVLEGME